MTRDELYRAVTRARSLDEQRLALKEIVEAHHIPETDERWCREALLVAADIDREWIGRPPLVLTREVEGYRIGTRHR